MVKLRVNVAGSPIVKWMNENNDTWKNRSKFHFCVLDCASAKLLLFLASISFVTP